MKRAIVVFFMVILMTVSVFAETSQIEDSFTGTSAQVADWIKAHNKVFKEIAADVSKVIVYAGEKESTDQKDFTVLFYKYHDAPKEQLGTVLEIVGNESGQIIYVVWTSEARGDDAVFYNDQDKKQLDVSVASRSRPYGMSNDTIKYVKRLINEFR
ncbi:hypothetical protein FACS1894190_05250 [Spirochaetia bacterium]|nr:hypothetical protein FACS1894190_05250 [Spirochaetia bacterium]